ncbi:MAG: universal stress protein [Nitrososphaerota archaeon]
MLTKPFQKILVGIDGSDKSLEAADYSISIAKNTNAQLIILNVLETEPWYYGKRAYEWGSAEELYKVYENEKAEIQKILDEIKEKAKTLGIQSKTKILMIPRIEGTIKPILKYAEDEGIDLIVVGTRGRTGIKRMLLGSVASGVVTFAHCPVMVVK